jgi:hypothetical protein
MDLIASWNVVVTPLPVALVSVERAIGSGSAGFSVRAENIRSLCPVSVIQK